MAPIDAIWLFSVLSISLPLMVPTPIEVLVVAYARENTI